MVKITLAIVTRNQARLLFGFLNNFNNQSLKIRKQISLLIIDDGSTDNTFSLLNTFSTVTDFRFVRTPPFGISTARNLALQYCKTRWIAFTDTDCRPNSEYFHQLPTIPEKFRNLIAVEGKVIPKGKATLFQHHMQNLNGGMYATANMVYNVPLVIAMGGFDIKFGNYREDVDLGLRISKIQSIPFYPGLTVYHPRLPLDWKSEIINSFSKIRLQMKSEKLLYLKHPDRYYQVRHCHSFTNTLSGFRKLHIFKSIKIIYCLKGKSNYRNALKEMSLSFLHQLIYNLPVINPVSKPFKQRTQKLLMIWPGGGNSAYNPLFKELNKHFQVSALVSSKWIHGGVLQRTLPEFYERNHFKKVAFVPQNSSRYLIPSLLKEIFFLKPDFLLWMDEIDRINVTGMSFLAKLVCPYIRIINYNLQNIESPSYYRWNHKLSIHLNKTLFHGFIAASPEALFILRKRGVAGPSCIAPLGTSINFFFNLSKEERTIIKQSYGLMEFKSVLFFAGSLSQEKGIEELINCVRNFPDIGLLIAGDGPLKEKTERLNFHNIHFLGPLTSKKINQFLNACDYVILPSRQTGSWKEQVGRILIEGIFCGCVALGSNSGSIPGITLYPECRFKSMNRLDLNRLLASLPLKNHRYIQKQQYLNAKNHYSIESMAGKIHEFLTREIP